MRAGQLNRFSSRALIVMSVSALLLVLYGYTLPPQTDEGSAAHIFQILIVSTIIIFLTTADWKQPLRSVRALSIPTAALILAFSALYYLEHIYYR